MISEGGSLTTAAMSEQENGFLPKDTVDILTQKDFFVGFREWCEMPARLEWRRTE